MKRRRALDGGSIKAKKTKVTLVGRDKPCDDPSSIIQNSKLLSLPVEVREKIWQYLYEKGKYHIVYYQHHAKLRAQRPLLHLLGPAHSSRQIVNETLGALYRNATFTFHLGKALTAFESATSFDPVICDNITSLKITEEVYWGTLAERNIPTEKWTHIGRVLGTFKYLRSFEIDIEVVGMELYRLMDLTFWSLIRWLDELRKALDTRRSINRNGAPCSMIATIPEHCRLYDPQQQSFWGAIGRHNHNFEVVVAPWKRPRGCLKS
ncbi:hypothetical protein C1H76_5553 [Elsinoe australis]|uniref:Uncharacterized protein n=1 Tax=Elsinoe australis TaxID=40998 RepID=A0A4U7AV05_9PEZI|nr:hypothetical protein C1H76_5553 [Elsinoe australis]